uniref:Uncharacterized protein n=1 Tax=Arundo donax TaxID=35708 RepID=A0A0A9CA04_ARUDO
MMESMERHVAGFDPCTLPPPFTTEEAKEIADREAEVLISANNLYTSIASDQKLHLLHVPHFHEFLSVVFTFSKREKSDHC